MTIRNLGYMFKPRSIAVIGQGTRDDSPDAVLEMNLIEAGFKGPVMPVNPDRRAVSGVLTYKDVAGLPEVPDLAIITRPLEECPALIDELGAKGTRAVLIVNQRLVRPQQEADTRLGQSMLDAAKPYLLRILGPDRLGIAIPGQGINATLCPARVLDGNIAVLSQSSAITRAMINWTQRRNIGFSHLVSMGSRLDVDFADMLDYLAQEPHSRSILVYLERIMNPRKFMSAARVAARIKPVIVLKPRNYGDRAVEDAVYDAAFRRAGLLRVDTIERLFNSVETLASAKPVSNNRLTIVGNSRSVSLLAADTLLGQGGTLAAISETTQAALAAIVPPNAHTENPVDLGGQAGFKQYDQALELLLKEPGADGVLIVHVPSTAEPDRGCARAIIERSAKSRRLVLASWVGAAAETQARKLLREAGIATYSTPDEAARGFLRVAEYSRNQQLLMETPPSVPEEFTPDVESARRLVGTILAAGRDHLNLREVGSLLAAYDIPIVATRYACNPADAAQQAAELEGPVALKVLSPDIPDRSSMGGVALALDTPEDVFAGATAMLKRVQTLLPQAVINGFAVQPMLSRRGAYELILGMRTGQHFGGSPMLFFGHGGTESEVINDIAYAIPPLNMHLAHELMSRTRIYAMIRDSRGRRADLDAIALTLLKLSQMIIDLPEIVELTINPLWANEEGVLALNAVVTIAAAGSSGFERLAIHPYPKEREENFILPDGRALCLRPILPEDEPPLRELVRRMPEEDRRLRFFQPIKELSHDMAARLTQLDYDREMALIVTNPGLPGKAEIWGVVRMTADPDMERAEYAIVVDRSMTGMGLGPMLMRRIINYARSRGIRELYGTVLSENEPMLKLNRAMSFTIRRDPEDPGLMHVNLAL
ncbi:MAG: bifunctional acetate--CoA ligase family protein/GNAT family N-acetyltransferase [Candidatus Competibacteraceae bacterium]